MIYLVEYKIKIIKNIFKGYDSINHVSNIIQHIYIYIYIIYLIIYDYI